ncbi:DUF3078 domain-containing protein [Christiangramia forsetii]|uniref:Secreted protein n=2 Tax=Christiangramia forsetii TaxID=411153 RepID=A0M623_CHRFK|nr:DUF3078 domain-containing protein [Christiangramia forsetii]GGG31596.1 protein of unknown function precursor [Christiangramia forsetii]CAL68068.1 conserved hypothetical protein, secreted [Christiangramia forsetii KT0803]
MKKTLLFTFSLLLSSVILIAQEEENDSIPKNGWTKEGNIQLLFNQSAFNKEWTGGGTSSIAGNLTVDYQFNYRKDDFTWDNKILANYGLTKVKGDEFARKTSDRLELNSIAGKQMKETNFYYTWFLNFRTQFAKGYEFGEDPDTGETIRTETTHFMSPGYIQTGPGIMYKKNDDFIVNFAPATARFILVDKDFTSTEGYTDGDYFGVDQGKSMRFELGASLSAFVSYEVLENVNMEHSLGLYSNYLEEPGNVDIDYLLNLEMGINDYLSANFIFQAIYDDNAVAAFQIREVFGLGINFGF